jgi:hypothetical protein
MLPFKTLRSILHLRTFNRGLPAMSIFYVAIGLVGLMMLPLLPDLAANLLISVAPG